MLIRRLSVRNLVSSSLLAASVALMAIASAPAWAHTVALSGIMGQRALLVIDDGAPAVLAAGESRDGVTLVSAQGEEAVVEVDGKRQTLRVGDRPVSVAGRGGASGPGRVVMTAGAGGHFVGNGKINGSVVRFLVDTGATQVALSAQEADRIGLPYTSGERVLMSTANGQVVGYQVHLDSVRVGDVEVHNVEAIVSAMPMPFVLLGNSYLNHFQLTRQNDTLTLEKRF
jgi:aspartyl protease family protein